MPTEFTCDGLKASPGLTWTQPPAGTQSFALIMDDPDAASRASVHWVVYDVPAGTRQISEAMPRRDELIDGTRQGLNDFGRLGYSGPCPTAGKTARYFFKLYALDTKLRLKSQSTKEDLERAMDGHILAQASSDAVLLSATWAAQMTVRAAGGQKWQRSFWLIPR
jgi:Raf kinase inhibitor-like YbhB/YbcL family protein